jgi:cation transport ATPase
VVSGFGWGSAWAGAQALGNKALNVDLLMIVAAIGAVAIGQIFDGALLIVIFVTSGALDDVATKTTADSVKGLLAMAAARTSVAMGTGADLTLQTADGVTARDQLHTLPTIIGLARHVRRVVTVNLAIAAGFVTVLVLWDLFGQLPLPLGEAGH